MVSKTGSPSAGARCSRDGHEHPVALEHLAPVGVVDLRDVDPLVPDVVPHVELGPVREREDADVLALVVPGVVEVPQLGTLVLGIPLAELVAEAEDPLLGPGLLLVPAGPAEDGVVAPLRDGPQQRRRLQPVARGPRRRVLHGPAGVDVVLHPRHHQADAEVLGVAVPELEHLVEVAPGVHVQDGEGHRGRPEGLPRQVQHDDGVLAAREHERRALELGRHLAEDVDRLGLEGPQMRQAVMARSGRRHAVRAAGLSHRPRVSPTDPPLRLPPVNGRKLRPLPPRRRLRVPRVPRAPPCRRRCRSRCRRWDSRRRPRPSAPRPASWRRWRSRRGPR